MTIAAIPDATAAVGAPSKMSAPQLEKLKKGATEFEAMLMQQLWKGMRDPQAEGEGETSGASGSMNDLGMQAMAQGLAKSGGLGIAKMVLKQLK